MKLSWIPRNYLGSGGQANSSGEAQVALYVVGVEGCETTSWGERLSRPPGRVCVMRAKRVDVAACQDIGTGAAPVSRPVWRPFARLVCRPRLAGRFLACLPTLIPGPFPGPIPGLFSCNGSRRAPTRPIKALLLFAEAPIRPVHPSAPRVHSRTEVYWVSQASFTQTPSSSVARTTSSIGGTVGAIRMVESSGS